MAVDEVANWRLAPASVATVGTYLSAVNAPRVAALTQSVLAGLTVYLLVLAAGWAWERTGFEWVDVSWLVPALASTTAMVLATVVAVDVGVESSTPMGSIVVFGLIIYGFPLLLALSLGQVALRRARAFLP